MIRRMALSGPHPSVPLRPISRTVALWLSAGCLAMLASGGAKAAVRYVKSGATTGNGQTWATAYNTVQAAIDASSASDEIWVAAGTYTPAPAYGDPYLAFTMKSGVSLYGGFAGTETARAQRQPSVNRTILSGDLNGNDAPGFLNTEENSLHVVKAMQVDASTVLDGFTIQGGNANATGYEATGGGLVAVGSSLSVANCTFVGNSALDLGGAVYIEAGALRFTSCLFVRNQADAGGAVANRSSGATSTVAASCVFLGNTALGTGGGAWVNDGNTPPVLLNDTFYRNAAANGTGAGGAIHVVGGKPVITNSILWGNTAGFNPQVYGTAAVSYSDVQGGGTENGNLNLDPQFANPAQDNLHLAAASPLIDRGFYAALQGLMVDADGAARAQDGNGDGAPIPDMGAYEFAGLSIPDAARALRLAAGVLTATQDDMTRLDVETTGNSRGRIDLPDAVHIARTTAGLGVAFTVNDVTRALMIAGGLSAPTEAEMYRYDVVKIGTNAGRITLQDATAIARMAR